MANVVVYTRPEHTISWERTVREFARVPGVGEYLALEDANGNVAWFQTSLVVLIGFQTEDTVTVDAEVFAVATPHREEMDLALHAPGAAPRSLPDA